MRLARLPIPAAPADHETLASYLTRLATLHGTPPGELWEPISTPRPGTKRRDVLADRLATLVGRAPEHLAQALPELRASALDWIAYRHQPQPGCPRCDARHDGGPVARLLPHHHYVCTQHRYWIGPPDAGQPATPLDHPELHDIVRAQRRHLRLVHRHGTAASFDAVLTGFLICGHLWDDRVNDWHETTRRWDHRGRYLIPVGCETSEFSASRIFAAVYPEAVDIAEVIASPTWRSLACGESEQQNCFISEIGRRLGRPDYRPPDGGDVIAHWMNYASWRPPSRPHMTFPDTREHGSIRAAKTSTQSLDRLDRSALWFAVNRRGGNVLLHHRHIRPVLIRDWSTPMDGIAATIWATRTTSHPGEDRIGTTVLAARGSLSCGSR
jgi:TniQ